MVHLHLQEASTYQDNVQDTIIVDPKIKIKPRGKIKSAHADAFTLMI